MSRLFAKRAGRGGRSVVFGCALLGLALAVAIPASATDIGSLQAKLSGARDEAASLQSELQAAQVELAEAEGKASAASSREEGLTALLQAGEQQAARLEAAVQRTQTQLAAAKRRLRRARTALADRLVAIYESGTPSTASVILASSSFDELATRTEYLDRIEQSDSALAGRVAQVRRSVTAALKRVATLKAKVDAYNSRLTAARAEVGAVRQSAEAASAELESVAAARSASLASLKSKIGGWVSDIEVAEAASRSEAEGTVERWLGGPYSIPTYIVMCESGGNYGAVNPSSGAGGATKSSRLLGSSTVARGRRRTHQR